MSDTPQLALSDLRTLWRQAYSSWANNVNGNARDMWRAKVREEVARRTIAELRERLAALEALQAAQQTDSAAVGEWMPITGHIIMCMNGEIQDVQAHSISGLPLPDNVAVCKRAAAPPPVAMPSVSMTLIRMLLQRERQSVADRVFLFQGDEAAFVTSIGHIDAALTYIDELQRRPGSSV